MISRSLFVERALRSIEDGQAGVRLVSACRPAGATRIFLVDRGFVAEEISARPPVTGSSAVTRIDEVRKALAQVLPHAAKFRKIGLITYGPGPYQQCNVTLDFRPMWNATEPIMSVVNAINPAGKTPLVAAVQQAATVLDYKTKPGIIVLLTDGEETCGGAPCALGTALKASSKITVHVIGYQLRAFRWTGAQSYLDVKCLAEETGGLYITAENRQDLIEAFEKTLGCPMMSSAGGALSR